MNESERTPLVYIVVLNWNRWEETVACVDSLRHLTYPAYSILVVDNGSANDSVARIHSASPDVITLESGTNLGFAGGCNLGIRYALVRGADFIWLLNNDTLVEPCSLQEMVAVAESDERIGAVGSVLYRMDEPHQVQAWGGGWVSFWTGRSGHYFSAVPAERLHYLNGASLMLRRSALDDVGLLAEHSFFMYWEDADLSFRLKKHLWNLKVAEHSIVHHKEAVSTGQRSPTFPLYYNESAARFFRNHSRIPAWPIAVGSIGRFCKSVMRRQWRQAGAVIRGTCAGCVGQQPGRPFTRNLRVR